MAFFQAYFDIAKFNYSYFDTTDIPIEDGAFVPAGLIIGYLKPGIFVVQR